MRFAKGCDIFPAAVFAVFFVIGMAFATVAGERVHFFPKFVSGETFYYGIETRSTTVGKTTTPIANPQGQSKLSQTISLLVRLDVVGVSPGLPGAAQVRFRATYEKSSARSESDAFNPDIPSLQDQYARIEGHSIEFTLLPDGRLSELKGLADTFPSLSEADALLSWAQALATGGRIPRDGIVLGQKWNNERPLAGGPLSGLFWRSESAYSRDDRCGPSVGSAARQDPNPGVDECAVILTHFEILHRGSSQSEATPEEYRRNGLRTSGTWTGSGESLDTISLASGFLENSTQTSAQNVDYTVTSASTGSRIHQVSKVQSQSEIRWISGPEPRP